MRSLKYYLKTPGARVHTINRKRKDRQWVEKEKTRNRNMWNSDPLNPKNCRKQDTKEDLAYGLKDRDILK